MTTRATPPAAAGSAPASAAADGRRWADLLPRLLSALVMTALAVGTAILGGHVFALFWFLAAVAILWEWQRLIGTEGSRLRFALGGLSLAVAAGLAEGGLAGEALLALLPGMAAAATVGPGQRPMAALGVLYAGALVVSVILLRASLFGPVAIAWLFAVVWGTDVMAYFGGRLVGGPKLWPRLSPSKTWSGFLVGISCGALAGLAVAPAGSHTLMVVLIGLAAGVVAQGGDILESAIKRRFGVKDASQLIPGHGGVMDRLDGFIVACVLALAIGAGRAGLEAAGAGLFNWS